MIISVINVLVMLMADLSGSRSTSPILSIALRILGIVLVAALPRSCSFVDTTDTAYL